MKTFVKRAITGFIYIALLVGTVVLDADAFDFLFLILTIFCLFEYKKMNKLDKNFIFFIFFVLWWVHIYLFDEKDYLLPLLIVTLLVNVYLTVMLFLDKPFTNKKFYKHILGAIYIGGGGFFLRMIPYDNLNVFNENLIIGVFILVWVNDSFAYIVGSKLGFMKLFKRISPKKTVEGFIGGFIFTLITAYIYAIYYPHHSWYLISIVVVVSGTAGDLVESKFKRLANIKDSGAILPGHGGLLDRLDSMIFMSPFVYLTIQIFEYVP